MRTAILAALAAATMLAPAAQAAVAVSNARKVVVTWSGEQFANTASATGTFVFSRGADTPQSGELGEAVKLLNLTTTDSSGVTADWQQSDFRMYVFQPQGQLDFTGELIGQTLSNGCAFGSFGEDCYFGGSGDFNLFNATDGAPNGVNYFQLRLANDDDLAVTSMTASAVPEPATWAMMIVGFGLVGSAARKRKLAAA